MTRGARGIIFDLDGTLIDSAPGILRCVREALAEVNPAGALPVGDLQVGPPVREMIAEVLVGADEETVDRAVGAFRRRYDADGWRDATAYPGIDAALRALGAEGNRLFIVTNKPLLPTGLILAALGWGDLFEAVVCRDSTTPPFRDKTAAVRHLLAEDPSGQPAILVGDTAEDARAAEHNGLLFVCVSYGYGDADVCAGSAVAVDSSQGLLEWLGASAT